MVILCLTFEESLLSSIAVILFHVATSNVWGSQCLHNSPTLIIFFFFLKKKKKVGILINLKYHLIIVLICISIMTSNVVHPFMCLLTMWLGFFGCCFRNIYMSPLPPFELGCLFFCCQMFSPQKGNGNYVVWYNCVSNQHSIYVNYISIKQKEKGKREWDGGSTERRKKGF